MEKKILIISEIPIMLRLLSMWLKKDGYLVNEAQNITEGLKLIKFLEFDLILFDLRDVVKDFISTLKVLEEKNLISNFPLMVLSNVSLEGININENIEIIYFIKPVSPSIILKKVKSLC